MQEYLNQIKWNEAGLVAAIAQDHLTGEVLMLAWMNRESLQLTIEELRAVYWSRSRNEIWRKGETSGHVQKIKSIALDCDGDALLLRVEQVGGIACHTGMRSCFHRELHEGKWHIR
jgi:phosphoribosyl-AMP cyclohydrolase